MRINDPVIVSVDIETYFGIVKRIDAKTADVMTFIGLIKNIPIKDINVL